MTTASMSSANVVDEMAGPSFQPFQCLICQRRFTRHENLKRHAALHAKSPKEGVATFTCEYCPTTFSRQDLRRRHMKRKHPEAASNEDKTPIQRSNSNTAPVERADFEMSFGDWDTDQSGPRAAAASSISFSSNDSRPRKRSMLDEHSAEDALELAQSMLSDSSILSGSQTYSNGGHHFGTSTSFKSPGDLHRNNSSTSRSLSTGFSPRDMPYIQEEWFPSRSQVQFGVGLFFETISNFYPFLHQYTFDANKAAPHLVLSMLSLAYQYGEDPDCHGTPGTGEDLSLHCFHRARVLAALNEEECVGSMNKLYLVQSYLLLQLCSMMYLCGQDSSYGLKFHAKMINIARSAGLMQPMQTKSNESSDLDSLWLDFIKSESHKRTLLALHQIDALWYQILSIPRSLSHLEIKHNLPCPEDCWMASSSAEWAHKQLITNQSASSIRYSDAVLRFLSPRQDMPPFPQFDPYGAINITQFLLSSVREVSGWSTMTGRVSLDRFEPLKQSLDALEPFVRPRPGYKQASRSIPVEATWEMAMIELQSWSPSHTGGIVESSMDAALATATYLASSCGPVFNGEMAKAIILHTNWFLLYLERTFEFYAEPPWIAIFAYKAFLIAWQLVRSGDSGAMQVVGVNDGDSDGAIDWARKVFTRRAKWQFGKLILDSVNSLNEMVNESQ